MSRLSAFALVAALACAGLSVAQPVRNYDDKGAPPFMVVHDGPGQANGYKTILDNLIARL